MPRAWIWLQVAIGWLPVGALFVALILAAHPEVRPAAALHIGLRMMLAAALLGLLVPRVARRVPWPRPFRMRFVLLHAAAALAFGVAWLLANSVIESLFRGQPVIVLGNGLVPFLVLGAWMYVMIGGVSYTIGATERAAHAEAAAVRAQLATLRGQLNPHFLFNALHTVVQLIPREPARAARAAEQVAGLLRGTLEEDRDLVPLHEEWAFVRRYLELEEMRFGDRLVVQEELHADTRSVAVPSFSVQTLVENAVRHGAAPREEPTTISLSAWCEGERVVVTVRDTGAGAPGLDAAGGTGTGLRRLRDRLAALYGAAARLDVSTVLGAGFTATMSIPRGSPE